MTRRPDPPRRTGVSVTDCAMRAVWVFGEFDFSGGEAKGVEVEEFADGRLANVEEEFEGFESLEGADESWEHAEDTCFVSGRDRALRRELRDHATKAGGGLAVGCLEMGGEDAELSFELVDRSVDKGLLLRGGFGGDEKTGGKVVGAVEDEVVGADEVAFVFLGEVLRVGGDLDLGVESAEVGGGDFGFGFANAFGGEKNLALEVGKADGVGVAKTEVADSSGGEVLGSRATEPAEANDENRGVFKGQLPCKSDLAQEGVAGVAGLFVGAEHG